MPVLSKAGCNMGTCHGNLNGKGGFKLSLRGEDPWFDYLSLTRSSVGRRVNTLSPVESLILQKPAAQLPHQGGRRFGIDSWEYRILRDWIATGSPGLKEDSPRLVKLEVTPEKKVLIEPLDKIQLRARAIFSDGSQRDVTPMVVYEPSNLIATVSGDGLVERQQMGETTVLARFLDQQLPIRLAFVPARSSFIWKDPPSENYIDEHIFAKLQTLRQNPSQLSSDRVFVRRAYLDTLGVIPTEQQAKEFLNDRRTDRRELLIDELLSRHEFAEFWALKWSDVLRNEEKVLDPHGVEVFHNWIKESFAQNKPLDQFVRELVTARGSTYKEPAANYWRAHRKPLLRAETTAQVFLGVRMQCAKCHNHPFGRWTQDDYYSWASLFARIDYKIVDKNKRKDGLDKNEFIGEQLVIIKEKGTVKNVRTGLDASPKYLGGDKLEIADNADRLAPLAQWLTGKNNLLFAKAQVNRIWFHLMGKGLVEPIDDFRATNPAINPELLGALAEDFIANEFNVRELVRTIMNSRVYQLSATPNESNFEDESNFSRAIVRRLTAEQILDAQCQVLGVTPEFNGYPSGTRAGEIAGVLRVRLRDKQPSDEDRFLKLFGKPQRLLACECERSESTTLSQALVLIGGKGLNHRITQPDNRLAKLDRSQLSTEEIVTELYWNALSRPPGESELTEATQVVEQSDSRLAGLEDLAWALLNAKEFLFRR